MRNLKGLWVFAFAVMAGHVPAIASDLTVSLTDNQPVSRIHAQYRCDARGSELGLPSGIFTVEYINRGNNHLAVVPVHGASQIFANVISGSGARYASGALIWWTGRSITMSSEDVAEKVTSTCEEIR